MVYTKESSTKKVIKFLSLMISDYVEIESSSIIILSHLKLVQQHIIISFNYTCTSIGRNCYIVSQDAFNCSLIDV